MRVGDHAADSFAFGVDVKERRHIDMPAPNLPPEAIPNAWREGQLDRPSCAS
jgi:hypothetical protein